MKSKSKAPTNKNINENNSIKNTNKFQQNEFINHNN